ncbi:hypothetical protein L9F63_011601, partial [Diploptera punctata]
MLNQRGTLDENKYYLKPINPIFLSSDVFTPDSLPRATQPNVGLQLVKFKDPKG